MCKFNKPQIPAGATADERRAIYLMLFIHLI